MTILFITRKFPPSTGGMESFSYELYNALKEKADVKLIKWGRSNKYLPVVLPWFFVKACWLLARGDIDVVHVNDGVLAPLGFVLGVLSRKPYTLVVHGLDITFKNIIFRKVNLNCVKWAQAIFCVSHATADEAINRGVSETKIHIIPNGVYDILHAPKNPARKKLHDELSIPADAPVLLTVGRLVERKGVAWFAENVMPELAKKYPTLIYLVAGDGENREKIEGIIEKKRLANHVKMLGRVTDEQMPTLYNGADIFVQPNIIVPGNMEGFGRVLLEASLCELPVVATGIEGIKDAVTDGENGVLVSEPKDAQSFIAAISKFIDNPRHARSFGQKSRTYTLKHFKWSSLANQYIAQYQALIKK